PPDSYRAELPSVNIPGRGLSSACTATGTRRPTRGCHRGPEPKLALRGRRFGGATAAGLVPIAPLRRRAGPRRNTDRWSVHPLTRLPQCLGRQAGWQRLDWGYPGSETYLGFREPGGKKASPDSDTRPVGADRAGWPGLTGGGLQPIVSIP